MHLLESCANQIALALEVDGMHEQIKKSELEMNVNQMSMVFSKSVAHDLRTPLVAMMGAVSTLMEMSDELDKIHIKKLANEINVELEELSRLINNLLQIIYLEYEVIKLQLEPHSLESTLKFALKTLRKKIGKREISTQFPEGLPKIVYDNILIQDVFINLIENALKFTPPESLIEIIVTVEAGRVVVSVADRGPGIVFDEVNKLFEKFYRGRLLTTERGLGLGLAICYSIIKAHGGQIWAENRAGGGAIFRFTLLM
jgi:two-component system sensor histidine kinase KdpD